MRAIRNATGVYVAIATPAFALAYSALGPRGALAASALITVWLTMGRLLVAAILAHGLYKAFGQRFGWTACDLVAVGALLTWAWRFDQRLILAAGVSALWTSVVIQLSFRRWLQP